LSASGTATTDEELAKYNSTALLELSQSNNIERQIEFLRTGSSQSRVRIKICAVADALFGQRFSDD
jgi:CTP:phosphocholine cytidylyltransferase-like protein